MDAVGLAETAVPDPDGEDDCAFGTHLTCLPFFWRNGHMTVPPTVGGNNGQASADSLDSSDKGIRSAGYVPVLR